MKYVNAKSIIKSTDKQSSEKNDCSVRELLLHSMLTTMQLIAMSRKSLNVKIKKVVSIWSLQGERSL